MSKATDADADSSTDADSDSDDSPEWIVESEGMALAKTGYSSYEFRPASGVTIEFSSIRNYDEEFSLRDDSRNDKAELELADLPEKLELAFTILEDSV